MKRFYQMIKNYPSFSLAQLWVLAFFFHIMSLGASVEGIKLGDSIEVESKYHFHQSKENRLCNYGAVRQQTFVKLVKFFCFLLFFFVRKNPKKNEHPDKDFPRLTQKSISVERERKRVDETVKPFKLKFIFNFDQFLRKLVFKFERNLCSVYFSTLN